MASNRFGEQRIVVSGIGMVTALGHTAAASCAAARAGLSRGKPLEGVSVFDPSSGELAPVSGHAVAGITDGFAGLGRLVRLGQHAIQDLIAGPKSAPADLAGARLFVGVSGGYYWIQSHRQELEPFADELPFDLEAVLAVETEKRRDAIQEGLIARLAGPTGIKSVIDTEYSSVSFGEQSVFFEALLDAFQALESGEAESCLVGCIDSLVDARSVEAISALELLKTPVSVVGFQPGEAAAFVHLETHARAVRRGAASQAMFYKPIVNRDPVHRLSDAPPSGRSLSEAVARATAETGEEHWVPGLVIGGLNGDEWRSRNWGTALVQLPAELRTAPHWFSAASFGEVGAAAAAVSVCMGIRALLRGYAPSGNILVWQAGDDGVNGSIVLQGLNVANSKSAKEELTHA